MSSETEGLKIRHRRKQRHPTRLQTFDLSTPHACRCTEKGKHKGSEKRLNIKGLLFTSKTFAFSKCNVCVLTDSSSSQSNLSTPLPTCLFSHLTGCLCIHAYILFMLWMTDDRGCQVLWGSSLWLAESSPLTELAASLRGQAQSRSFPQRHNRRPRRAEAWRIQLVQYFRRSLRGYAAVKGNLKLERTAKDVSEMTTEITRWAEMQTGKSL